MPIGEGRATAEVFAPSWRHFKLCSLQLHSRSLRTILAALQALIWDCRMHDVMPGILASTVPTRTYM